MNETRSRMVMDGLFQWFIKTRKNLQKIRFFYRIIVVSYVITEIEQMGSLYIEVN